ncbi:hypothetical protein HYZ70_00315 [Candidatus Curtissbacteria bacterium]|nr:hypothetical protein [Candidatus Curtissbacteria bacterium]
MTKIDFVIPQTQGTVRHLLAEAGWKPEFEHGHPEEEEEQGQILNRGIIRQTGDAIIQVRSMDALRLVASGSFDVGMVGTDCILEKPTWKVEKLAEFSFGRLWGFEPPRLEIVVPGRFKTQSLRKIKPGAIFLSERPAITRQFLQNLGFDTELETNGDPSLFKEKLIAQNQVGIWEVLGAVPVQLKEAGYYGVMVNESGRTVRDYDLRVIDKILDISTVLIANPNSFQDEQKRERIWSLRRDLEVTYKKLEAEIPRGAEPEAIQSRSEEETQRPNGNGERRL